MFRDDGFRVVGLVFRDDGFRVEGLGFRDDGFRVEGLGFRDDGFWVERTELEQSYGRARGVYEPGSALEDLLQPYLPQAPNMPLAPVPGYGLS